MKLLLAMALMFLGSTSFAADTTVCKQDSDYGAAWTLYCGSTLVQAIIPDAKTCYTAGSSTCP